jgi:UDP-2-acetamido-2,6-beta-L-arabino-hexul-4-ose reductase
MTQVDIESIVLHKDQRGVVFEPLVQDDLSVYRNLHVVISQPGAIRGNHFHPLGKELVAVEGPALVRYEQDNQFMDVNVPSNAVWKFTFPPGTAHAIKNTGENNIILIALNTLPHNQKKPDCRTRVLIPS